MAQSLACWSCSELVPEGARFCPSCGAPQRLDPADEERKVVTVVFADMVGFTALAERRDPEQVKRLVDALFERLTADVEAHGGMVDKVLGDGLIALFGAPVAHEDDADRAVRAALGMQDTLRAFRDEHPGEHVRMRIGVNTGEVLVGPVVGSEYTAMGDVVNTASRLQEVAPPGAVYVAEATHALCSPSLRFRAAGTVRLRGRDQETAVWQAVAHDTAVVSRRWSSDVEFVGRRPELALLEAVATAVLAGRSAIVGVTGEPGIGKSRLVAEAVGKIVDVASSTLVLEGSCAPYGEPNVWWPVAGGLLARLGLDREGSPEEVRERAIRRLEPFGEVAGSGDEFDRTVELVMHLLGLPSTFDPLTPAATRDAVVAGIVGLIRRRAALGPVVVWVDDLQWAAPLLLELLESLARQLVDLPVLIVGTYRAADAAIAEWPPAVEPSFTMHVSLEPLTDVESARLVQAAAPDLPSDVAREIVQRSGGNPLFIVELASLAACGASTDLPGTLRALVAARLDQLTASQRALLDNASILGASGRVSALRQFAVELGQHYDPDDVTELERLGLLERDGHRWRFRSDVVREVAYRTLTKQARAQRHAGVARYLAAHEERAIEQRAHHSATAAELVCELGSIVGVEPDIESSAIDLLTAAARRWNHQGAHRRALQVIDRGLALTRDEDARRVELLLERAETLVELRELRDARMAVAAVREVAEADGDPILRGDAARLSGTLEQYAGNQAAAREQLADAVAIFREIGDRARLAEALRARGFAEIFGGSLAEAQRFLDEAALGFAAVEDARGAAWVQQHLAWVSFLAGDHDRSRERLATAIAAFERLDDRAGRAWSEGLLAYIHHFTRANDEALAVAASALDAARGWGDEWGASMMLNLEASVHLWRGELDAARLQAERSLAGFRRLGDSFGTIQALGTLSRVRVALGRFAEADRSVEEVLSVGDSFGSMAYPAIVGAGVAMHRGDGRRAVELAEQAVRRLDTAGANVDEGRVVAAFGHLLAGDTEAALTTLIDVDVESSPFALAARATALALLGDRAGAVADADRVGSMGEVSYWDRTVAAVVGAAASGSRRRRSVLATAVTDLDDVVISGYANAVLARLAGDAPPPSDEVIGGWADLAGRLAEAVG